QNDYLPVGVRQTAQLLVEEGLQFTPEILFHHGWFGHHQHLLLSRSPSGGGPASLPRRLVGHPVKPVGDSLPRHNQSRLADEDEERSLKSILGVVMIEQAAANAPDHGAMLLDKCSEGGFVPAF